MAVEKLVRLLKKGADHWNNWRSAVEDHYYRRVKTKKDGSLVFPDQEMTVDLTSADLRGLELKGLDLTLADLRRADLRDSILDDIDFSNSDLSRARFGGAELLSPKFVEADLKNTDFRRANIVDGQFADADLTGASFRSANIDIAYFGGSILKDVDFTGAYVGLVEFDPRDFTGAVLKAELESCVFRNVDLSQVKGLASAHHRGPSTIGIDTFFRSRGKIPKRFFLGAGVPISFVNHSQLLLQSVSRYYSCFISHSSKDNRFCERFLSSLRRLGIPAWYFPDNAKWGRGVWTEIDRAIHSTDKVIVVCSESSLVSDPVLRELERALQREEKEKRDVVFPIRLDNFVFDIWESPRKADVTAKVIGDFRKWKDGTEYAKSLQRLLANLGK